MLIYRIHNCTLKCDIGGKEPLVYKGLFFRSSVVFSPPFVRRPENVHCTITNDYMRQMKHRQCVLDVEKKNEKCPKYTSTTYH